MTDELPSGYKWAEDQSDAPEGYHWTDDQKPQTEATPSLMDYPAAIVAGAARNVPYATGAASALNAAKTYIGMHPTGVPTEGSFESRRAAAREQLDRAQKYLSEQYPITTTTSQIGSALAVPSIASGIKAATPAARALLAGTEQAGYGALAGSEEGGLKGALTGATVGGLTGGAFGALAPKPTSKAMTDIVEAGERVGVPVPFMAASDSVLPRMAGAGAEISPLGGYIMGKRAERSLEKLGEAATNLAGPTRSVTAIGETAKDSLANWVQHGSSKEAERLYKNVDKFVDPKVMTPAQEAMSAMQDIVSRREAARLPTETPSIKLLKDAVTDPQGLTYAGMKDLRTRLGGMLGNPTVVPGDIDRSEIKSLYDALSKDLRGAVTNAGGPNALAAFDKANSRYSQIVGQRNQLAKIIGKDAGKSGETVYSTLTGMATNGGKADIRRLELARKTMGPQEWQDLTSGVISNLGQTKTGFSPAVFNTGYAKLSDAGKDALFGPPNNPLRRSLDDIHTLSKAFEKSTQFRNTSRTASTGAWGASIVGLFADPITTISANLGAGAVGELLSHPMTARSLANLQQAKLAAQQAGTGASRLAVQAAVNSVVDKAKEYAELDIPPEVLWDIKDEQPRRQLAHGGRVDKRDYPAKKATRLEKEARRAHREWSDELRPMMDMPDHVIATALRTAKH